MEFRSLLFPQEVQQREAASLLQRQVAEATYLANALRQILVAAIDGFVLENMVQLRELEQTLVADPSQAGQRAVHRVYHLQIIRRSMDTFAL